LIIFLTVWVTLALLTGVPSPNRWIVLGCWLFSGVVICFPTLAHERRCAAKRLSEYDKALSNGQCDDYSFAVRRYWEVEEVNYEGPVYGFEFDDGRVVFVVGQEFYKSARFPNSAFSLVSVATASGKLLISEIKKTGVKISPERVIPSSMKRSLRIPNHLELADGPLEKAFEALKTA